MHPDVFSNLRRVYINMYNLCVFCDCVGGIDRAVADARADN